MYNYFCFDIDTTNNERIRINLVRDFLLPHHLGETSFRVSPLLTSISCRLNRSRKGYDPTCWLHAQCRKLTIWTVPSRTQSPFQKRLHFSSYDLCGLNEKNDESFHSSRKTTRSTFPITLVGWCQWPTSRIQNALRAVINCRTHSIKSKVLLPIHSQISPHCLQNRLRTTLKQCQKEGYSRHSCCYLWKLLETRKTCKQIFNDRHS